MVEIYYRLSYHYTPADNSSNILELPVLSGKVRLLNNRQSGGYMPGELFTTRDVEAGALQIRALLEQAKREAERVNQAPIEPVYYANPLDALQGASLEDLSLPPQERCTANNTIFNEGNSVPGAAASSLDFVGRQMAETQILKAAEKRNQGDEVEETMRASKVSSPTLLSWLQQYLVRTPNTLSDEQAAKVAQGCVEDKHSFLMRR